MFILHTFRSRAIMVFLTTLLCCAQSSVSAQELTVSLTGSMHNGSSIPCFGKKEGTIVSTVTGGAAPYYYDWSNGESTPIITGLSAGFYSLDVKDADGTVVKAVITLTEPEALKVDATASTFSNGYNISCFECNNGSIQVVAMQGTPPYSYTWSDGPSTAQNRYTLAPGAYKVTVTDANGCSTSTTASITQPERSDWTMSGNAGTNPATQFIGSSDNTDVVFKANGQESLRLKANGGVHLFGSSTATGLLWRRADGTLDVRFPDYPPVPTGNCYALSEQPFWQTTGNDFDLLCPNYQPRLGTVDHRPLSFITFNEEKVRIGIDGSVGIGTTAPEAKLHVVGGLFLKKPFGDILSRSAETEGTGLWVRNYEAAWGLSIDPDGTGHILGDWNDPRPALSFNYDRVTIANRLVIGEPEFGNSGVYKAIIDGGVACRDVLVKTGPFPDYVFQPDYALMPLGALRTYLHENSHLPGIPSATEVEEKGGVEVGDLQVRMLRALEEQALYILQLEERLQAAEERLNATNSGK